MRSNIFIPVLMLSAFAMWPTELMAQAGRGQVREGNALYEEAKYDEALNAYRDALLDAPESPKIQFNMGGALYQKKSYEEALSAYQKSLIAGERLLQSQAYYNMGNTQFRSQQYLESIESYKRALDLNPDDVDAKFNLEYVRNFLKQNAEEEQPQPEEQQQEQDQQEGSRNDEGEEEESQNQESESEQQEKGEGEEEEQGDSDKQPGGEAPPVEPPEDQSGKMTEEEAAQILRALEQDEKNELKKSRQAPTQARVAKDW